MVYFSSVEFFKQPNVYGFSVQVSGVRIQMTENGGQKAEIRYGAIGSQCNLSSGVSPLSSFS